MAKIISILFAIIGYPSISQAGHFGLRLNGAIIPSLLGGIGLLLLVQGGYYVVSRMVRAVRYREVVRFRRQKR